ncbi:Elongator complex protein 2 [Astathelohania contejeani]|uniref:Elongator complex protein 2 n=1 Tax=Astathelohania contejeani TaxID=164912 RepID=A0ABQ7I217_9MICR|nr:Elongator complex protein 2 [Thelohania contejeani]
MNIYESVYTKGGCNRKNHIFKIQNDSLVFGSANNVIITGTPNQVILIDRAPITTLHVQGDRIITGDAEGNIHLIENKTIKFIYKCDGSIQGIRQMDTLIYACTIDSVMVINEDGVLVNTEKINVSFIECVELFLFNTVCYLLLGCINGSILLYQIGLDGTSFVGPSIYAAHNNSIKAARYALINNEPMIATTSQDKLIKIWKIKEDKLLLVNTLSGHTDWVQGICWIETEDLVSCGADNSIIIWKYNKNKWTREVRLGGISEKNQSFYGVEYNNNMLYAQSHSGGFYKYKIMGDENSYKLLDCESGNLDEILSIDWKGNYMLTGSMDSTTRIYYKKQEWNEIARPQVHGYPIKAARFIGNGFISGAFETILRIYKPTQQFFKIHMEKNFNSEEFSHLPQRAELSELSLSNELKNDLPLEMCEINERNRSVNTVFPEDKKIYGHFFEIEDIAVSDKFIVSCNRAANKAFSGIFLWNLKGEKLQYLELHSLGIIRLKFSKDGKYLLAVSRDKTCSLYEVLNELKLIRHIKDHKRIIWDGSFSYDNKYFATGSRDRTLLIYDLISINMIHKMEFEYEVTAVCFGKDKLYVGLEDGKICVLNINSWEILYIKKWHSGRINVIEVQDNYVATGGKDGLLRIHKLRGI